MFVNFLVIVWRNAGVLVIKLHASSSRPFHEKFCQLHVSIGGCDSVAGMTGEPRERQQCKGTIANLGSFVWASEDGLLNSIAGSLDYTRLRRFLIFV